MFRLKRPSYKSRRDAYGTFFSYFSAPWFILGLGIIGVSKSRSLGMLSYDQAEQSIVFAVVISALIFIYCWYKAFLAVSAIMNDDFEHAPDTVICLNCQEAFTFEKIKGLQCPKCSGTLQDLAGFYDRHPELRE